MSEPVPTIARLDRAAMISRLDELQATLRSQWPLISSLNHEPHSVVVVPSMSLAVDVPDAILRAYEGMHSLADVVSALARLRSLRPGLAAAAARAGKV